MSQEVPVQTLLTCSSCGKALAQSDLVQIAGNWVCADCKPAYLSRVMASGAAGVSTWRYSGFWIRFGARIVDGFVLAVPLMLIAFLLLPNLMRSSTRAPSLAALATFSIGYFAAFFLIGGAYEVLMLKYRAATLGKMVCGLKVVVPGGNSLSWGVCVGRFFMWNVVTSAIPYLNMVLMAVSSIMVATDGEKRALHDRVCGTRVIYSRA